MRRATGAGAALALLVALVLGGTLAWGAPGPQSQPEPRVPDRLRTGIGMTVPWAVGGPRIEPNGQLIEYPGQWPTLPVSYLRLWDTRTAWLNIEPANDQWDFSRLDEFLAVAERNGVDDVNMVLAGTPRWAASQIRPTDAPWLGPGSASPPKSLDEWTEFVRTVATRYRGRIDSYTIGNEPTDPIYWSGTRQEWGRLVASAAEVISSVDPRAVITSSGLPLDGQQDARRALPWLRELADLGVGIDVLAFHWYPRPGQVSRLAGSMRDVDRVASQLGLPRARWITEANIRGGGALTPRAQRAAVSSLVDQAASAGVDRIYWYAWLDIPPRQLMPFQPGTPAARELARIYRR